MKPNGRTGWILVILAIVSFCGGMGAWALKEWIVWEDTKKFVLADEARDVQLALWQAGAERELATLSANQCVLFRLVNVSREKDKLTLAIVPVECREDFPLKQETHP